MREIWRPVPGYEGSYLVSDRGRVRSKDRSVRGGKWKIRGKMLAPSPHLGGYFLYQLHSDGRRAIATAHGLVAAAFVGPRPAGQQVRHLDGNPRNNTPANLAYGTARENAQDKRRHGTHLSGEQHPVSKLNRADVLGIRAARGTPQKELAEKYGCTFSNISAIQRGKSWRHV